MSDPQRQAPSSSPYIHPPSYKLRSHSDDAPPPQKQRQEGRKSQRGAEEGTAGAGLGVAAGSGSQIWLFNTKEAGMQRVNPFGGLSSANKGTGLQTKVVGGGAKGEG